MMRYLAVLGRQPEISVAELEAQGWRVGEVQKIGDFALTEVEGDDLEIRRFGGLIKIGVAIETKPLEYLLGLPEGKVTFGLSDYNRGATGRAVAREAIGLKRALHSRGRSARVVESPGAVMPVATALHNGLSGRNPRKVELVHFGKNWYRVTGVQDIDAYAKRDQNRPARDAKIGMLPPKLAQVLINLAGGVVAQGRILDPFCGTGVVLQEAILLGFRAYGTDIDPRMVKYSQRNLVWLCERFHYQIFSETGESLASESRAGKPSASRAGRARDPTQPAIASEKTDKETSVEIAVGDATNYRWRLPIDAVVTEGYLGEPMSRIPTGVELGRQREICAGIALGFLKNLHSQIAPGTGVVMCLPAWRRENGENGAFERLKILDEIENLGYNVSNRTREGLIYHRVNQIVARDIIILRKR